MNYKRMTENKLYKNDEKLKKILLKARRLLETYNSTFHGDYLKRQEILKELLGHKGNNVNIQAPFYCDYGTRISMGDNSFVNFNGVFLDQGGITIGNNVMIGPNAGLYSASHPIDPIVRITGLEFGKPIVIEDNVWLGGSVVVNPGVRIGKNSIIGSGSVVTKDIPANVIAFGNPCKVYRQINEEDKKYWLQQQKEWEDDLKTKL